MLRATATSGVWQNRPPLPPGIANAALSAAIARSHDGHELTTGRRGQSVHLGDDRLGDGLDGVHHLGAHLEQVRRLPRSAPAMSAKL